jgi:hypothetical protein
MLPTKHTSSASARGPDIRLLLAAVTLVLVVLTVMGIQSVADRVTAPRSQTVVQALGSGQAAAPAHESGGIPLPLVPVIAVLVLAVGVRFVVGVRSHGSKQIYWDDMW